MLKDGVSVITCCFNSAKRITATLQHLALQVTGNLNCEIILVDNASTDDTSALAQAAWQASGNPQIAFRIITEDRPGVAYARIKGITEARYSYIVFCDDDNWLDQYYLQNVHRLFSSHPHVGVLGGNGLAYFDDINLKPDWFDNFSYGYAVGNMGNKELIVGGVYGAGMGLRTLALQNLLNSYNLQLYGRKQLLLTSGEDTEICNILQLNGYKVLYSPLLTYRHYIPIERLSWKYLRKLYLGFADSYVVLNLYGRAIETDNKTLPPLFWLKQSLYYWGIYFKYWHRQYKIYKHGPGTTEEINHISWRAIAIGYLKYNFKTVSLYKSFVGLKQYTDTTINS